MAVSPCRDSRFTSELERLHSPAVVSRGRVRSRAQARATRSDGMFLLRITTNDRRGFYGRTMRRNWWNLLDVLLVGTLQQLPGRPATPSATHE